MIDLVKLVNDFHGMEWTFSERDTRVEFMDRDIEIEDGSVVTRVFEKPMALHQYLPPYSAQPLSEISSPNTSQPIGVNRLIIGYRRHQNIGNLLSLRRFDKLKGPSVSSYNLHNRSSLL